MIGPDQDTADAPLEPEASGPGLEAEPEPIDPIERMDRAIARLDSEITRIRGTSEPPRSLAPAPPDRPPTPALGRRRRRAGIRTAGVVVALALTGGAIWLAGGVDSDEAARSGPPPSAQAPGQIGRAQPASPLTLVPPGEALEKYLADPEINVVAQAAVSSVKVHKAPGGSEVTHTLANPTENGGPLVFLVHDLRDTWLHVDLPVRPNGTTGWIRASDVGLSTNTYRIEVSRGKREFRLYQRDELIMESPVAIGATDTPTPGGVFYIKELLQPPNPNTVYGPYAFGLSGFSNVLENFAGGEGVIGIHGTNDPDAIGKEVSKGCIRLPNDEITELAGILPLGTPVAILE